MKYAVFCSLRYREINSESEYSLVFREATAANFYCVLEEKKCKGNKKSDENAPFATFSFKQFLDVKYSLSHCALGAGEHA